MNPKAIIAAVLHFIFFLALSMQSNSQSVINGTVVDEYGAPVSNATVLLLHAKDSSLVKGTLTAPSGRYSFKEISPGNYILSSSFTSFRQVFSPAFVLVDKIETTVEALQLLKKENEMKAVVVSAKKPLFEQKIDRMIINVASSVTNAGSSALEVLMRSPGIIVDQQNNSLSMNGKDGVVIMINGKISRMPISAVMQMLAGMSASNIEKIELITTPPANFDAEGNAGFINIVMKTNTQLGTNGSYSLTAGYGRRAVGAASINFNHRAGKWNLYGDYSFARTGMLTVFSFYRKVMQGSKSIETLADTDRDAVRRNHNGRLGLDIDLSKKTTLGFLFSTFSNLYKMESVNTSYITVNSKLDTTIIIDNAEEHPISNYSGNVNLYHQISPDDRVALNLDYVYYNDANDVNYFNKYYDGTGKFLYDDLTRSYKTTPIRFWVGSADYIKKLSGKINMELGLKATFSDFTNDVRVEREKQNMWAIDQSLTAIHFLKENIYAAYSTFSINFNKTTAGKAGLRYEYTNSNLESETVKNIVDRHYGKFFPSLFVSHALSEKQSVNFSYTRRITRPTFNDMAPFVYFVDPNTLFSGNPALQPAIANSLKADYLVNRIIFSLTYTNETSPITNFAPRVDSITNKQTLAAENQKDRKIGSFNISLPIRVNNWWSMQNNISGLWQELNAIYKAEPLQIVQKTASLNSSQTFTFPKSYTVELRGYVQSGGLFGIYQLKPFASMDFGVQKKFDGDRSSLRFNISDIIGVPHFKPSVNLPEQNLIVSGNLQFTNSFFRLTFTHNFGNTQLKENRARATASEEEKQRVNSN